MIIKIELLIFFLLNTIFISGQNLIRNSEFNAYEVSKDENNNIVYSPKFWYYKRGNKNHPIYFCSDKFLNKSFSISSNYHPDSKLILQGYTLNYVSIPIYPQPDKIYTELIDTLQLNKIYKLNIDIRIYDKSSCFTDLIIGFSKKLPDKIDSIYNKLILHIPDTITWNYISHNWVKLSAEFKATGKEKYLIVGVGNTIDYSQIIRSTKRNLDLSLNYLVDNITLIPIIEQTSTITTRIDSLKIGQSLILKDIYFEFNKSNLLSESYPVLSQLAKYLKDNQKVYLQIIGHTDNVGSNLFNKNLSMNRAKSVVYYLASQGIEITRLKYDGKGASQPISTNESAKERQKNRRVEFKLIKR